MRVHGIGITQLSTDWLVQKVSINYLVLHRLLGTEDGHFYAVQHRKMSMQKTKQKNTHTLERRKQKITCQQYARHVKVYYDLLGLKERTVSSSRFSTQGTVTSAPGVSDLGFQ